MKVRLLFSDRDADQQVRPPEGSDDLVADLDLGPVLEVMRPDKRLDALVPSVLLNPVTEAEQLRWRQAVLGDAISNPTAIRALFDLAGRAEASQHAIWMFGGRNADSLLTRAVHGLTALLPLLRELAELAAAQRGSVSSPGLRGLYQRLIAELDTAYLAQLAQLLRQLTFSDGAIARARLGPSGLFTGLELLAPPARRPWWMRWGPAQHRRLSFTIADRDESGAQALATLSDDVIYDVAATVSRAHDHVVGFFRQLRWETGWYVGCVQLQEQLVELGQQLCWPKPGDGRQPAEAEELVCLSQLVRTGARPVPNDLAEPLSELTVITGANQGGKTTFLRAVGCAQLLLQAGMFVPARSYRSGLAPRLHTQFRRCEDEDLDSGKLAEELVRISAIVDRCRPGDLVLMNEPFAATDEIEGTYLATDIIDALLRHGVGVLLVTHFHGLARHYTRQPGVRSLIAERLDDGRRSFRLRPGGPESTSHGLDLYRQVFGDKSSSTQLANPDEQPLDGTERRISA